MSASSERQYIHLRLAELPIRIPADMLRDALKNELDRYIQSKNSSDPRNKALLLALKIPARMILGKIEAELVLHRSPAPLPDHVAMKADVLEYALTYILDLLLFGFASTEWDVLYDDLGETGGLEIAGLAPAIADAESVSGTDARHTARAAGGDNDEWPPQDRTEYENITGDRGSAGGSLAGHWHLGERQNDAGETPDSQPANALA